MEVRFILLLVNIFLINASLLLAFLIRHGGHPPEFNFAPYRESFVFLTIVYMLALAFMGVFKSRFRSLWDLSRRISAGLFLGALFGIALVYVFRTKWASFPSSIFVISHPVGLLLVIALDSLILRLAGRIKKKVVIMGQSSETNALDNNSLVERKHIDNIEELLRCEDVDELVICERIHDAKKLNLLIYLVQKLRINVVFSPSIYVELLSQNIMEGNSIPFLSTFIGRKSECEEFLIRALDVFVSVLTLAVLSPLIGLICLLIRCSSPRSPFYKQVRVTKDGRAFVLYKFKTMNDDAEKETGPVLAVEHDPRVTRIGRFLRKTHLNELPQLLNVIRGDMSLVGPRPERPHSVKRHKVLREMRLAVRPGLTGLAQIRGLYNLRPKHKIRYDYLYIQKRSFLLNLLILMKTIPVVFSRNGW